VFLIAPNGAGAAATLAAAAWPAAAAWLVTAHSSTCISPLGTLASNSGCKWSILVCICLQKHDIRLGHAEQPSSTVYRRKELTMVPAAQCYSAAAPPARSAAARSLCWLQNVCC
jgi:hypothetical protein